MPQPTVTERGRARPLGTTRRRPAPRAATRAAGEGSPRSHAACFKLSIDNLGSHLAEDRSGPKRGVDTTGVERREEVSELSKVERLAKRKGLDADGVRALRQRRSVSLVTRLYRWPLEHAHDDPPDSPLAKAVAYAPSHEEALTRFLDDGRVDIDDHLDERQIRSLALGRKNDPFAGSHDAARRSAVGYTSTRSCAPQGGSLRATSPTPRGSSRPAGPRPGSTSSCPTAGPRSTGPEPAVAGARRSAPGSRPAPAPQPAPR